MKRPIPVFALLTLMLPVLLSGCHEQDSAAAKPEPKVEATPVATAPVVTKEQKMPKTMQSLPVANQHTNAELQQRYTEIKALVGEAKATEIQQCRKVALGYKACGGPQSYLIYSVLGLDEAMLLQKVGEYNALAEADAHRLGLVSDCSMVLEPGVTLVGGVCKAGPSGDLF